MKKFIYPLSLVSFAIALYCVRIDNAFAALFFGALYGFLWNESINRKRVKDLQQTKETYERYIEKHDIK